MAKDFFDEEFEKKSEQGSNKSNDWFDRPAPQQSQQTISRPMFSVIISIGMVLCIALGWVLCAVFQGASIDYNTDGNGAANYGDEILSTVMDYLKNNYYKDVDDETWLEAIEYSGTALLQKAGDKFSQLMSPQTYYDFVYSTGSTSTSDEIFGVSFIVEEGVGLYVSSVVANSAAYGKLQEGDIVLKLSHIVDKNGKPLVLDGVTYDSMVLGEWSSTAITTVLGEAKGATFHVLRFGNEYEDGYQMLTIDLVRQKIKAVPSEYPYTFIEFYFNDRYRNVSVPSRRDVNGNYILTEGEYSTYEERCLDQLPSDTGYVRITQFMDYVTVADGKTVTVSAAQEFTEVMGYFRSLGLKHLVLDLKGNPGGNVAYVCDVAALLVTEAKLSAEQKALVTSNKGLLITSLDMVKYNYTENYSRKSLYSQYFGEVGDKCSIVVWTDGGSASASELLTGALRDYQTAVQMGVTTYGKGIAQTWKKLPFYGTVINIYGQKETFPWAIYFTVASYYSPFGDNIHGFGYTPAAPYNNLKTYADLWQATNSYWK